jgi:hypothetical protein
MAVWRCPRCGARWVDATECTVWCATRLWGDGEPARDIRAMLDARAAARVMTTETDVSENAR